MRGKLKDALLRSVDDVLDRNVNGVFVELGVQNGRTARQLCARIAEHDRSRRYIGVDFNPKCRGLEKESPIPVTLLRILTVDAATHIAVPVAWLFVDACHCRNCVAADIDAWAPKITQGGALLFHDTEHKPGQRLSFPHPHGRQHCKVGVIAAIELYFPA